jgi:hypothetical protein
MDKIRWNKKLLLVLAAVIAVIGCFYLWIMRNNYGGDQTSTIEPNSPETIAVADKTLKKTDIISYHPLPFADIDYPKLQGTCQPGSSYFNRSDIYTCKTQKDTFQNCFVLEKKGLLLCGIDPLNEQTTGALFESENELAVAKTTKTGTKNIFFALTLENQTNCVPLGDLKIAVNGAVAIYQCPRSEHMAAIFEEPVESNGLLTAKLSIMDYDKKNNVWSVISTETDKVAKAWH